MRERIQNMGGHRVQCRRRCRYWSKRRKQACSIREASCARIRRGRDECAARYVWHRACAVIKNVCEDAVVKDPISGAENSLPISKDSVPEFGCVCQANTRRKVVLVALLFCREVVWKYCSV